SIASTIILGNPLGAFSLMKRISLGSILIVSTILLYLLCCICFVATVWLNQTCNLFYALGMANKIWYELVHIKYGETYLGKYIGLQHRLKKSFKIMTLVLSVSGIFGWKYFEDYAWIAFVLIAIMQLLTLVENQLIRSDKEVEDISKLRMRYTKYFN